MNEGKASFWVWVTAIAGTFLLMGALIAYVREDIQPEPIAAGRAKERKENRIAIQNAGTEQLSNVGWLDQSKGMVRLSVDQAMQLTIREWQNPAAARSNMLARSAAAVAASAPPPPPPNPYE